MSASTPESAALARELKRRGFRFVGPTTVYALMQGASVVNDPLAACWVREAVDRDRNAGGRSRPEERRLECRPSRPGTWTSRSPRRTVAPALTRSSSSAASASTAGARRSAARVIPTSRSSARSSPRPGRCPSSRISCWARRRTGSRRSRDARSAFTAEEPRHPLLRLARALELRHVAAVEREVLGLRQRLAHVALEGDRHDRVAAAPHEERRYAQLGQPRPEAVLAVGLL